MEWFYGFKLHLVIGDKGYLSAPKRKQLRDKGMDLVTSVRRNMRHLLMKLEDKILLRKRAVIESRDNLLTNWANIGHTRHRCPNNFLSI